MSHFTFRMRLGFRRRVMGCLLVSSALTATPASSQDEERIWGRVYSASGEHYEGFIRWANRGRLEKGTWADIFEGTKESSSEDFKAWLQATGTAQPVRTLELMGYRISWDEEDPDFSSRDPTEVRFGRLAGITVPEGGGIELTLRSGIPGPENASGHPGPGDGQTPQARPDDSEGTRPGAGSNEGTKTVRVMFHRPDLRSRSSLPSGVLALVVDDRERGVTRVHWNELERVEFATPPTGRRADSPRIHGTVTDRFGRSFTGYITWDSDESLESDVLDGDSRDRRDLEIPFGEIRAIKRISGGARVTLASGEQLELSGTNDVDRRNRGVKISETSLGMVEVAWEEFSVLHLHPAKERGDYGVFARAHPLFGTVRTGSGEEIEGRIRWDADEEWSWEFLNGEADNVKFTIEFGHIRRIERGEADLGVRVTLLDGRAFELRGSNDVGPDNRGIFVFPSTGEGTTTAGLPGSGESSWRYVPWKEVREVRFEPGAPPPDLGISGR